MSNAQRLAQREGHVLGMCSVNLSMRPLLVLAVLCLVSLAASAVSKSTGVLSPNSITSSITTAAAGETFSVTLFLSGPSTIQSGDVSLRVSTSNASGITTPFREEVRNKPYSITVCPEFISTATTFTIELQSRAAVAANYTLLVDSTAADLSDALTAQSNVTFNYTTGEDVQTRIFYFDLPQQWSGQFFSLRISSVLDNNTAIVPPLREVYLSHNRCPGKTCPGKRASKPNGRCDWDAYVEVKSSDRVLKLNSLSSTPGRYYLLASFKEGPVAPVILQLTNSGSALRILLGAVVLISLALAMF